MPVTFPVKAGYAGPASDADAFARVRSRRGATTPLGVRAAWRRAMRVRLPRATCAVALLAGDVGAFLLAGLLATLLDPAALGWLAPEAAQAAALGVGVPLGLLLLSYAGHGHYARRVPFWGELHGVLSGACTALLGSLLLRLAMRDGGPWLPLGLAWGLFAALAMPMRGLTRRLLARAGLWQMRVVLVGRAERAQQAARALLSEPQLGYRVAGVICPTQFDLRRSGIGHWRRVLQRHGAGLLVLSMDAGDAGAQALTESLVRERVPFAAMPRLDGLPVLGFAQTRFFSHDAILFSYRNNLAQPLARSAKLLFDLAVASLLLLAAAPVLLALAFAVRLDGGPALYAHRRVGANGREFPCLKFRSMVVDGDAVLRRVLDSDPAAAAEWSETRKLRRDPRVTWIGRWLRATSLDELPQLLNVLRLEMSLVGPRPIVRSEVARYGEDIAFYYEARPGLTGLWQVSGRSDASYAQRVQLDTWYVKNWTLWHDVAILAKTLPAVLQRRGAV